MIIRSHFAHHAKNRFLFAFSIALIACFIASPARTSSFSTESVGFTSSPRGHLLVPVSIDGSEPLVFVLDTGAGKTSVTPSLAERLGLEEVPGESASTLGVHGKTENPIVKLQSIAVGEALLENVNGIVLDLEHVTRGAWHVDGILGMDFLTQFDVQLDFKASQVSFFSAASSRSGCVACPEGIDGIGFDTIDPGFIVLPATLDAKPVSAVLDSGSGHSGININAATALGVSIPPMPPGTATGHGFGLQTGPLLLGNETLSERATLHVMDHPVMESLGLANRPTMLLGTDQLQDRTVTICYGLETLFVL